MHGSTCTICVHGGTLEPGLGCAALSGMLHVVGLSSPAGLAGSATPEPKLGLAATSGLCFLAGDPDVSASLESGRCSATSGHPAGCAGSHDSNP